MNAESRARLQDFLERASHVESLSFMDKRERIADCRLRREGDSWQAEFFHPTDEQRDALLFNLRLFIQDKDDISLRRLTELYDDPDISAEWKREHAEFRGELKRRFDRVAAEGPKGVLRHEDLFRMVLYGALAHRDADDASFQQYRIWVTNEDERAIIHDSFWQVVVWILATVINIARISQRELARVP